MNEEVVWGEVIETGELRDSNIECLSLGTLRILESYKVTYVQHEGDQDDFLY